MVNTASSKGRAAKSRKAAVTPAERRRAAAVPGSERRRATPAEQLGTELLSVKTALDGALAQFGVRVSGRLAEVLRALESPEPPSKRTVREMIVKTQAVKLRPERGRVKDLLRLRRLADELAELLARE